MRNQTKRAPYTFHFFHQPRENNQIADWLTNVPRTLGRNVSLQELNVKVKRGDPPPWSPQRALEILPNATLAVLPTQEANPICPCCLLEAPLSQSSECWGCASHFHHACIASSSPSSSAPWHCPACVQLFATKGTRDVTLDKALMSLVCAGVIPPGTTPPKRHRVLKAAQWLFWDGRTL